jgi:hypothetical protein
MRNKPVAHTKQVFDYNEMADHINKKFNVYIDDFAGKFHLPDNQIAPDWFLEWTKEKYGVKDINDLSNIQIKDKYKYGAWFDEYRDSRKKHEPPYQNFWHFILDDVHGGEISNGSIKTICFVELKEIATEDWQQKILDMFIAEFGDKPISVEFSW